MKKIFSFFLFFFLLISLTQVSALKATARNVIPFEPGGESKQRLCVISEGITEIALVPEGWIKEYIELPTDRLDLNKTGKACINYTVHMPQSFDKPGIQSGVISVQEAPKSRSDAMIRALIEIKHQVWIEVPYPGKYLTVKLSAKNAEAGELVLLQGEVTSKGKETVESVQGTINIYDWEDERIGTVETNTVTDISTEESADLNAVWNSTGNTVGDYYAVLHVDYDGKKNNASNKFKLGTLEVRLSGATGQVYKGGIVPYQVHAESYWSESIRNVNAHVRVLNNSEVLEEFNTISAEIDPWQKKSLKGYLDTSNLPYGNYTADITLNFGDDKSNQYERNLEVAKEPVKQEETQGFFSKVGGFLTSTQGLLILTILFAVIALALAVKVFFQGKK